MRITNRYNLDAPFVRALEGGEHIKTGDISVTRLLAPLQQTILMKRYGGQVSMDASDSIWMFMGTIGHSILESFAEADALTEEMMAIWVHADDSITPIPVAEAQELITEAHEGAIVSSKIDRYSGDGELVDWKLTKTWSHIFGSRLLEWTKQLSIYRAIMAAHGIEVADDAAHITEFLIDWQQGQTMKKDYPERGVYKIPIKMWPVKQTNDWIVSHVKQYLHYLDVPDEKLLPCSAEERWARPEKWAVYKNKTVKKASRLLGSEKEAYEYISEHLGLMGAKPVVKFRRGISTRCERYCLVAPWCAQRRAELEEDEKNGQNQ